MDLSRTYRNFKGSEKNCHLRALLKDDISVRYRGTFEGIKNSCNIAKILKIMSYLYDFKKSCRGCKIHDPPQGGIAFLIRFLCHLFRFQCTDCVPLLTLLEHMHPLFLLPVIYSIIWGLELNFDISF